jgi:hypothetical protein
MRPETHPWFGAEALPSFNRAAIPVIRDVLRHELRDCGTWLHVEPVPIEPFVVDSRAYIELFTAARGLLALLRRAIVEAAPTRRGRLAALGLSGHADAFPFFTNDDEQELRYCAAMARPDVVIGPDGPQFLEFNVSGAFGGPAETHLFTRAWLRLYEGPDQAPFKGPDPLEVRADLFVKVCKELGLPPAVAVIGNRMDRGKATTTRYFDIETDALRRRGLAAEVFEPRDLPAGVGEPGRLRFPLALRYFAPADWVSRGESLAAIHAVLDAGCLLFPPESSYLLANKKVLAWLSEGQPWMNDADRQLVHRYVPWTRVTTASVVEWDGAVVDLHHLLSTRQELFVLKPAVGMMGCDVLLGNACSTREWAAVTERALQNEDYIVQAYVEPGRYQLEMVDGSGSDSYQVAVAPVLSPCLFGGRAGGCYARYFPSGDSGVVGVARRGAMENALLSAP